MDGVRAGDERVCGKTHTSVSSTICGSEENGTDEEWTVPQVQLRQAIAEELSVPPVQTRRVEQRPGDANRREAKHDRDSTSILNP